MSKNDFLLPDELGWDCNDELNALVKSHIKKLESIADGSAQKQGFIVDIWIAELLDDTYAIIKKYQTKQEAKK